MYVSQESGNSHEEGPRRERALGIGITGRPVTAPRPLEAASRLIVKESRGDFFFFLAEERHVLHFEELPVAAGQFMQECARTRRQERAFSDYRGRGAGMRGRGQGLGSEGSWTRPLGPGLHTLKGLFPCRSGGGAPGS